MEILGLVPARGGSKGIPAKNLVSVGGRPLLAYTSREALKSSRLTRVVLSTDDDAIARCGKDLGLEVPFMRPGDLAGDNTPMVSVVLHALESLADTQNYRPDLVVLLQPTSPLRRAWHIDGAIDALLKSDADTAVSVMKIPHRFHPYSVMKYDQGRLTDFMEVGAGTDRFRRQALPELYARNGPAVLVSRSVIILRSRSLYGDRIVPYLMEDEESLDIDTPFELKMAEYLLRLRGETG